MTLSLAFSPCPNDCFVFDARRAVDPELAPSPDSVVE